MTQTIHATEHLNPDTVSAFIDGEIAADEDRNIQQHLAHCHSCALRVLSATQLKAATARAGRCFAPAPEALKHLTARLHPPPPALKSTHFIRPTAWAALAAVIVLALSLIGWRQFRLANTLAAELLDQHLSALSSGATPQVIASDRHTVKPWFQGRLPFSFNLPETEALPPDTILRGADLTYFDGQPAALLIFTVHKHQVTVFLTQRPNGPVLTSLPKARSGFTIHSATASRLDIIAVSDVNPAELDLLIAALVRAQE